MAVTGGSIVTFRIKGTTGLQPRRHVWPLFGAYVSSDISDLVSLQGTHSGQSVGPIAVAAVSALPGRRVSET